MTIHLIVSYLLIVGVPLPIDIELYDRLASI
jgi:hypothetical protein